MMKLIFKILTLPVLLFFFGMSCNAQDNSKHLINWSQSASVGGPQYLSDHWDFIETQPFDGVVIFLPSFRDVMAIKPLTYQQVHVDSKLSLLAKKFNKVRHNFLMVWAAASPLDAFDDWSQYISNFGIYARAAKDAGISGIIFDDEQYYKDYSKSNGAGGVWEYPLDVKYASTYTAEQYRTQMRLRGRQIMTAMVEQFPDIQVIFAHGPYWSESQAFIDLPKLNDQIPSYIRGEKMLIGSLFSGFVEASVTARSQGKFPKVIDGGEIYWQSPSEKFTQSDYKNKYYDWRKHTIASGAVNSLSIPPSLRPDWANNVSISYGHYSKWGMTPSVLRNNIEWSLKAADDFVWYYNEDQDWYNSGGIDNDWLNAVRDGFAAGRMSDINSTVNTPVTQLLNASFDENGDFSQEPAGWATWTDTDSHDADYAESHGGSRTDAFHDTHWSDRDYRVYTYQMVNGLASGTYTLSAWVRRQGAQNSSALVMKFYGNSDRYAEIPETPGESWVKVQIADVWVSSGQCEIGIWSDAHANEWVYFEDFELILQGPSVPAGGG